ncbi:hypothetical protein [Kitasatospora griseola]|uniref:hypothetical protein n=1 Tax=Kitasatospora griseola TaxID=2064 RepID=UPI00365945C8
MRARSVFLVLPLPELRPLESLPPVPPQELPPLASRAWARLLERQPRRGCSPYPSQPAGLPWPHQGCCPVSRLPGRPQQRLPQACC